MYNIICRFFHSIIINRFNNYWYIQQVYGHTPFFHEQLKIFETNKAFYSLMFDTTKIISAACFVQFINQKSKEYFGYCSIKNLNN